MDERRQERIKFIQIMLCTPNGEYLIQELGDIITEIAESGINSDELKGMCKLLAQVKRLAK